jgi:hypothetical protein
MAPVADRLAELPLQMVGFGDTDIEFEFTFTSTVPEFIQPKLLVPVTV